MHRNYTGYVAVIISGIIFGCMPLLAKIIFINGGNAISLVFWRFLIGTIPLYIIINRNKNISFKLSKREIKQILLLGTVGHSGTAVALFLSYNYISTGMATTLHFIYPILVILGCTLLYKEKLSIVKLASVMLCTLGIVLLYDGNSSGSIMGILLAFGSGIAYAFYVIYIDKSGLKSMNPLKLTMYLSIVGSVVMLAFSIMTGNFTADITPLGWLITVILALVVSLAASLLNIGIKLIGPQSSSILSTFEPITSVILGALVFGEKLGVREFLACILILIAVILISISDIRISREKDRANAIKDLELANTRQYD